MLQTQHDVAKKAHNCQANPRHRLQKRQLRFGVRKGRTWEYDCADCTKTFVTHKIAHKKCDKGKTRFDSACVDLDQDDANCGRCCQACDTGGTHCCLGACVDTGSDPQNHGNCRHVCDQGEVCSNGTCGKQCPGSKRLYAGACVEVQSNPQRSGQPSPRTSASHRSRSIHPDPMASPSATQRGRGSGILSSGRRVFQQAGASWEPRSGSHERDDQPTIGSSPSVRQHRRIGEVAGDGIGGEELVALSRPRAQRRHDTEHRLARDIEVWVASASANGAPVLVPLTFDWDGEALRVATPTDSTTGRTLAATRSVRLELGHARWPDGQLTGNLLTA